MNYRLILCVVLLFGISIVPASARLTKIASGAPVYTGEVGLDISSALNGCQLIAWWPAGNDTGSTPGKILKMESDMYNYNISPDIFSGYEGKWYSWDKKPNVVVFDVQKPYLTLLIWDIDQDREITGQTVSRSTRITYRIETNLYHAVNYLYRPDLTPLDLFFDVRLQGPNNEDFTNVYTGSAGLPGTLILKFDTKPDVKTSPYLWKDGGSWNHTARSGDGSPLYPLGTYTFTASQNLNNMRDYYDDAVNVTTSGPKTVTFIADQPTAVPTAIVATQLTTSPTVAATTMKTAVVTSAPSTAPTKKQTWTSTPLPPSITILAFGAVCLLFSLHRRNQP
jgi:hypothetical protein